MHYFKNGGNKKQKQVKVGKQLREIYLQTGLKKAKVGGRATTVGSKANGRDQAHTPDPEITVRT